MFCIWCSWILYPYLAVCGMPLFKRLHHPYNQSGGDLAGERTKGSTFSRHLLWAMHLSARHSDKERGSQDRTLKRNKTDSLMSTFVQSWQGPGTTYYATGMKQMKHLTTQRKQRVGQHKYFLLALSQRHAFVCGLNIDLPIKKLWPYSKKLFQIKAIHGSGYIYVINQSQTCQLQTQNFTRSSNYVRQRNKNCLLKSALQIWGGTFAAVYLHCDFKQKVYCRECSR